MSTRIPYLRWKPRWPYFHQQGERANARNLLAAPMGVLQGRRAGVATRRKAEARTAAVLGLAEVVYLHYPAGAVENTRDTRPE